MRRFLLTAALLLVAAPLQAQQPSPLPPGNGRDAVAAACSQCHALTAITQLRQGPQGWRHNIYDMFLRGAQVSPDEVETMVDYLTVNFGPGVSVPPSPPVTLPAGQGMELVEAACGVCHGLDRVVAAKRRAIEWDGIVAKMVYIGAPLTSEQAKSVSTYLAAQYGAK